MKEYFTGLFEYDHFASRTILEAMARAANPEKTVKLMAHMLAAQQVWFNRCKALPPPESGIWPDWPVESLASVMAANSANWLAYLDGLAPADFDKVIGYKNLKGDSFESKLRDILTQVTNHGTHHRAQIGQHLVAAGIEPLPATDYIFYLRVKQRQ